MRKNSRKRFVLGLAAAAAAMGMAPKNASAEYLPGFERPVLRAKMSVTDASGEFEAVKKDVALAVTRTDGSTELTGMVLRIGAHTLPLRIVGKRAGACGTTEYLAIQKSMTDSIVADRFRLVLRDHSTRVCTDVRDTRWEARFQHYERGTTAEPARVKGVLLMAGNPEGVVHTE